MPETPPVAGSEPLDDEYRPAEMPAGEHEPFADLAFDEEPEGGEPLPPAASSTDEGRTRPRRRFRRRLMWRLLLLLFMSVVVPLSVEGVWFYYRTYEESTRLYLRREEVVLDFALSSLNQWLVQREARVTVALNAQDVQAALQVLQTASPNSRRFANARALLFHRLQLRTRTDADTPLYTDFVLLSPQRRVLVATEPTWEGLPLSAVPFGEKLNLAWDEMLQSEPYHWIYPLPRESPTHDTLGLATAFVLRDDQERVQGVLVGIATDLVVQRSLIRIQRWMPSNLAAFVLDNGQVYVWDPAMQTLQPESAPLLSQTAQVLAQQPSDMVFLEPYTGWRAFLAQRGLGSVKRLVPYPHAEQQIPYALWWLDAPDIIGLGAWVPALRAGLFVLGSEESALAGVRELLELRLVVWTLLLVMAFGGITIFGRDLLRRVRNLVVVAESFAQGHWDARAEVTGSDELALLAYTFNDLADRLQETYATMERELNLRTQQVQLVVTMATAALETTGDAEQALNTILQRMAERFPQFAYLSLRLWHAPDQGWQPAARASRLPQAVNLALRAFEPHLAAQVGRRLEMRLWPQDDEGESLRLPPPLTWMVGVPLATPQHLLGVLFVGGVDAAAPGEYERFALRLLARQFSLVLEYLHLLRGQRLEVEKQRALGYILEHLPQVRHLSQVIPTVVEGLRTAQARGVLLVPLPELTDAWTVVYPTDENQRPREPLRNLLPLVSEGPAHVTVDEGDALGGTVLARLYGWQTVGLYPVRGPQGQVRAIWARGTRIGEGESPVDRTREQRFAELLAWVMVYVDMQQRLSVWEVVQKILEYTPEAPSEGHLYLRAWDLLQKHLPKADFFVASRRGGALYTFVYPYGQRYYHTTVTPVEQALIQQVLERGQPLLLSDKAKIITQAGRSLRIATIVPQSWLGVPVVLGRQRLGVLGLVQRDEAQAFTNEHRRYLETLAQGLAGVLYYIQQEGRLRRRLEREQSLRAFAQHLTGLTDVRNLLEFSAAEMQRLFEARRVEIELFATSTGGDGEAASNAPEREE